LQSICVHPRTQFLGKQYWVAGMYYFGKKCAKRVKRQKKWTTHGGGRIYYYRMPFWALVVDCAAVEGGTAAGTYGTWTHDILAAGDKVTEQLPAWLTYAKRIDSDDLQQGSVDGSHTDLHQAREMAALFACQYGLSAGGRYCCTQS